MSVCSTLHLVERLNRERNTPEMAKNTRYTGIKKLSKGTFHVRVTITDPRTGKRREKKDTVHGKIEDALAIREKLRGTLTGRQGQGPRVTRQQVSEFAEAWIERKRHEIGVTTIGRYQTALNLRLLPYLGEYYYDALGRDDVQSWANARLVEGFRVTTVKSWFRVLTTMTRDAIAELQLACDPTLRIRFPEEEEGAKSEPVTPEELERFLTAMWQECPQHYALVIVLAYTGLRFCHASGLRLEDWDEKREVVRVRRSQVRGMISPVRRKKNAPKVIPLLPVVTETLRWHRDRMRRLRAPGFAEGWLFPSQVGTLRSTSSLDKAFRRCRRLAGITARFTPHGLRYTLTDTLRVAKVDPIIRRQLIGHLTDRMQANYSTVRVEEHREALAQAAELIRRAREKRSEPGQAGEAAPHAREDVYSTVYSDPGEERPEWPN